jgi:hypothetical protein
MWTKIERHAANRQISVEITIQDAWEQFEKQGGFCALTGVPLTMERSKKGKIIRATASLDRIDNSKPYSKGNIQWLHKYINIMKKDHPQDRFIDLCHQVSDYWRKDNAS